MQTPNVPNTKKLSVNKLYVCVCVPPFHFSLDKAKPENEHLFILQRAWTTAIFAFLMRLVNSGGFGGYTLVFTWRPSRLVLFYERLYRFRRGGWLLFNLFEI